MWFESVAMIGMAGAAAGAAVLAFQARVVLSLRGASAFAALCVVSAVFALTAVISDQSSDPLEAGRWIWTHDLCLVLMVFLFVSFSHTAFGFFTWRTVWLLFLWTLLYAFGMIQIGIQPWAASRSVLTVQIPSSEDWVSPLFWSDVLRAQQAVLHVLLGVSQFPPLFQFWRKDLGRFLQSFLFLLLAAEGIFLLVLGRPIHLFPLILAGLFVAILFLLLRLRIRERFAVRERVSQFQAILSLLPEQGLVLDSEGICLESLRVDSEEGDKEGVIGKDLTALFGSEAAGIIRGTLRWALVTRQIQTCRFPMGKQEGKDKMRWGEGRLARIEKGRPDGGETAVLLYKDITEERELEQQTHENLLLYQQLFHLSGDALLTCDLEGRVLEYNKTAESLFGGDAESWRRRTIQELFADASGETYRTFMASLLRNGFAEREAEFRKSDGLVFPGEIRALMAHMEGQYVCHLRVCDITARRAAAERMLLAAKMEGIAHLARGLSHHYNNLLVGILGGASLLKRLWTGDPEAQETLTLIERAGTRGSQMVERLRSLSGLAGQEFGSSNIWTAIEEVTALLRKVSPSQVCVVAERAAERPWVRCDPTVLREILLNLGTNARDALPPEGGRILFRLEEGVLPASEEVGPGNEARPEGSLVVRVMDNGIGMTAEVRRKIFEPFFTTKPPGKGTGLGLSMVYSAVHHYGGAVEVESEPGKGTTVSLWFPRVTESREEKEPVVPSASMEWGRGRILLVDDDPVAREATRRMLETMGYEVVTADGGLEAIGLFTESAASYDLVVLDVGMPDMDGPQCFRAFRAIRPDIRVIFVTGGDKETIRQERFPKEILGVLRKPYRFEDLQSAIGRLLGEEGS